MHNGMKRLPVVIITFVILLVLLAKWITNLYIDWLWFKSLGYSNIFKTILVSELGLRLLVGIVALLFIFFNLMLTRQHVLKRLSTHQYTETDGVISIYQSPLSKYLSPRVLTATYFLASIILAAFISTAITGNWVILQKYLHSTGFGFTDPIFNKDIGEYVFKLPFYQFIYRLLTWYVILAAFAVTLAYFLAESGKNGFNKIFNSLSARWHLSFLAVLFFLIRAWGYRLEQYMLLYSENGFVFGPGYTDIHARLVAYKVLFFISLFIAIIVLINLFMRRFRLILYSIGALLLVSIVLGGIYPTIIQYLIVTPNELSREIPYINNAIKYTRMAYDLNTVELNKFSATQKLSSTDIQENIETVQNIRLWDWRPLEQTYEQLQEIRPYYDLKNIDIDRYMINNKYRQVMLAARELNQDNLPLQARNWINERLKYTHGYGIAMNPVNEITSEGLPRFFIQNIPPESNIEHEVTKPEIYFGELTNNYVIVNTKTSEFDYPIGNENAHTTYKGKNGVKIGGFINKIIFALAFGDYKLLLSGYIQDTSQILYYRNIHDRVSKLAPFLKYDSDPYIVLDEQGDLYWLWDAYTVSDMYPYSEPFNGKLNYIRNSVKIAINAYTGKVDFYIANSEDPIIKTYDKIFPGVFKPLNAMPEDLKKHIRYPVDLFMIQAEKYTVYHMTDPEVLYNQEDKWNIPTEKVYNEEVDVEPYYTITKLPNADKTEFVLIMPFTPKNKTNMIAWMAARSDEPSYGKLVVYEFPKQQLIYGPMQIEARIDQDTTISQQLTLWNQRGSSVIRGNLLVIPLENALLYVEPLYLQAEQSKMPELRRVIVAHGDQVVMEPTLELALQRIFGAGVKVGGSTGEENPAPGEINKETPQRSLKELISNANDLYNQAQERLKNGDWAGYGEAISKLKETLDALSKEAE